MTAKSTDDLSPTARLDALLDPSRPRPHGMTLVTRNEGCVAGVGAELLNPFDWRPPKP
jgi:hypothetical protein